MPLLVRIKNLHSIVSCIKRTMVANSANKTMVKDSLMLRNEKAGTASPCFSSCRGPRFFKCSTKVDSPMYGTKNLVPWHRVSTAGAVPVFFKCSKCSRFEPFPSHIHETTACIWQQKCVHAITLHSSHFLGTKTIT